MSDRASIDWRVLPRILCWLWARLDTRARRSTIVGVGAMLGASIAATASAATFAIAVNPAELTPFLLAGAALLGVTAQTLDVEKWRRHEECELRLERALTLSLFNQSLSTVTPRAVGAEMQVLVNVLVGCRLIFQHLVFTGPSILFSVASASVVLASMGHVWLALVTFAYAPLYLALAQWRARKMARYARSITGKRVEVARRFADALANKSIVGAFGAQSYVTARVGRSMRAVTDMSRLHVDLRAQASMLSVAAYAAALMSILTLAWYSGSSAGERVTLLVFASVTLASLLRPLELAAQAFRDLILALAMVAPADWRSAPIEAALKSNIDPAAMSLQSVSVRYGDGRAVLSGATLIVAPGSVVGVRGESGIGKSTFLRLIVGELTPDEGSVLVAGKPAPGEAVVSIAPQETFLLDASIAENIVFGRSASRDEIRTAVQLAGLEPVIARLTDGLDTHVGERGTRLSGGERQRVSLARAVLKPAAVYLFDEATSALDPAAEKSTMRGIVERLSGATILIVAHRETAFEAAEAIVELRDGKFTAQHHLASSANVGTG